MIILWDSLTEPPQRTAVVTACQRDEVLEFDVSVGIVVFHFLAGPALKGQHSTSADTTELQMRPYLMNSVTAIPFRVALAQFGLSCATLG